MLNLDDMIVVGILLHVLMIRVQLRQGLGTNGVTQDEISLRHKMLPLSAVGTYSPRALTSSLTKSL